MVRVHVLLLSAALLLSACASIEAGEGLSASDVPPAWDAPIPTDASTWPEANWWQGFDSAELDQLIADAQAQNLDLAIAAARILQAEAQARAAGSVLLPSVDLRAGATQSGAFDSTNSQSFSVSLGASYEVDFWGRNAADVRAAEASLRASQYDRETVALTVIASTASTYFQLLSLRDRVAIAKRNLENAQGVLKITEARVNAGVAVPLELAQQRANVAGQEANIPQLEQQERETRAALALLLGRPVQGFDVGATTIAGIEAPTVAPGLPSELLARRPDVRRAEAQLVAADANIAAARAAFFPSISLSGSLGASSAALASLFNPSNIAYSIGASLLQTIFDGGQRQANLDATVAQRKETLLSYRGAVIAAFSDVDVALGAVASLEARERASQVQADEAREAFRIAELRYRAGVEDFLSVLDAQRSLNSAEDQLAQAKLARLQAAVTLFRVLGGGWSDAGVPVAAR
jgi:NodT family efflux transporter outer membrane factor (OMF) lipoprotein